MAKDLTELLVIVIIIIIILIIIVACCRGLRRAYEEHTATENLARQRHALFLNQLRDRPQSGGATRTVRITTISQGGAFAMGVYEIRVPRDQNSGRNGLYDGSRQAVDTAPPAYEVSTHTATATAIDIDEPPPTYDDYIKCTATKDTETK